jgi:hypothetical protein
MSCFWANADPLRDGRGRALSAGRAGDCGEDGAVARAPPSRGIPGKGGRSLKAVIAYIDVN